jgi:signal peptidase I
MSGTLLRWCTVLAACALGLAPAAMSQRTEQEAIDILKGVVPLGFRSIPSEHMVPNLLVGDRVAVVAIDRDLRRGDVVIYRHPNNDRLVMITRIVGLPGDTVQMKGGQLILNGEAVPRNLIRKVFYVPDDLDRPVTVLEYEEQLPGAERPLRIFEYGDSDSLDETPEFHVPEDRLFLLGDNRDNSEDSRAPSGHPDLARSQPDAWPYRGAYVPPDPRERAIGFVPFSKIMGRGATVAYTQNACRISEQLREAGAECLRVKMWEPL